MNAPDSYRVTRYIDYGVAHLYPGVRYFRWYWQANAYSWFLHHILGYSCNTWKKK